MMQKDIQTHPSMDRRFRKNHRAIRDAYMEMIQIVDPVRITVKSICDKADINRSTFYQHYAFLEQLEEDVIWERMQFISNVREAGDGHGSMKDTEPEMLRSQVHQFIQNFVQDPILLAMIGSERGRDYLHLIIRAQCRLMPEETHTPLEHYSILFQNAGACSLIIDWMQEGMTTPISVVEEILWEHLILLSRIRP